MQTVYNERKTQFLLEMPALSKHSPPSYNLTEPKPDHHHLALLYVLHYSHIGVSSKIKYVY